MNATLVLMGSLLRQTVRNRQGLFWTLFFPLVLMFVFSFLGNSQSKVNLAVVSPSGGAQAVVKVLKHSSVFHVQELSQKKALQEVKNGNLDAALFVPQIHPNQTTKLTLRFNNANLLSAQESVSAVEAFIAQADVALSGRPPLFEVSTKAVAHSHTATYLDFLLPGVLALMTMQNSLFGIGSGLTRWKEKGILRRFRITPVKPLQFLTATVANYIVIGLITSAIIIGFSMVILHASVTLAWGPMLLVLLLAMGCFLSIGFIVAGFSKTQEATIPIINLISFPMMFLSGIFFPVSSLPKLLGEIVQYFPLTYVSGALRGLMSGQLTTGDAAFRTDIIGMAAWIVATGVIAARTWRWE